MVIYVRLLIAVKRFHRITKVKLKPTSFKCALIPANHVQTPPGSREFIEGAICLEDLPYSPTLAVSLEYVGILLQTDNIVEVSKFYDRDPCICDWYYQAYGSSSTNQTRNSVANIIKEKKKGKVCGDVVIMKNGPLGGVWESSPDVDIISLSSTLWWYQQSGRDLSVVFRERGFLRMVGDLNDA